MVKNRKNNFIFVLAVIFVLLTVVNQATAAKDDLEVIEPVETSEPTVVDLGKEMSQANVVSTESITPKIAGFDPLNYTLGPEDVIEIQVLRHPEFGGKFPINLEGKIQYKFVGDIEVTGLTKRQLEEKLDSLVSKYVISPKVDVTILEYRSKVIYVLGEVASPGKYYMKSESITIREAAVVAGLPTYAAAMRKCQLITPAENGKVETKPVNLYEVLYGGDLDKNIEMHPGDVLYVPATVMAKVIRIINPVVAPVTSAATGVSAASGVPVR